MLKSQDVLVALAILIKKGTIWRQTDIAHEIGISPSEVNAAIKRLTRSKIASPSTKNEKPKIIISALKEFLIHGLKYVFPAQIGEVTRGVPTSYAAPCFGGEISYRENDLPVWPNANGKVRGYSLTPLYDTASDIQNEEIYFFLSMIDAIRAGRAREKKIGIKLLEEKLDEYRTT
tara:strand:- start:7257 stop:7781 length:525 start_codon:yes stop_codon:yes gene_type:complete